MQERYDEGNGLTYTLVGDYWLPNLISGEIEERRIGRFGRQHKEYLKNHHPVRYIDLKTSGNLTSHLMDIDEQATNRRDLIVKQMKAAEGVTEDLKAADPMAWVQAMNNITNRANDVVWDELVLA